MKAIIALIIAGTLTWGAVLVPPALVPVAEAITVLPPGKYWWEDGRTWDTGTGLRFAVDCSTGEWYSWDVNTYKKTGLRCPPTWPPSVP